MPTLLLCLVVVGVIFLACYGAYLYGKKRKTSPEARAYVEKELNKVKIMDTVYGEEEANKKEERVLKISILEKLNVSPDVLKNCIKELTEEQLINETDESVTLTAFGTQYHEVFFKKEGGKRWE